jgi:hypothetical protein
VRLILSPSFSFAMEQTDNFSIFPIVSDDVNTLSYITGALRGVECAGQAVAFGVKSSNTTDWLSVGLNVGLFAMSIPFAWFTIRRIGVEKINIGGVAGANGEDVLKNGGDVGPIGPATPLEKEKELA